jgi:hypothetical protein
MLPRLPENHPAYFIIGAAGKLAAIKADIAATLSVA